MPRKDYVHRGNAALLLQQDENSAGTKEKKRVSVCVCVWMHMCGH